MERVFFNYSGGIGFPSANGMAPSHNRILCFDTFYRANAFCCADPSIPFETVHAPPGTEPFRYADTMMDQSAADANTTMTDPPSGTRFVSPVKASRLEIDRILRLFLARVPMSLFPQYTENDICQATAILTGNASVDLMSLLCHYIFWRVMMGPSAVPRATVEATYLQIVSTWTAMQATINGQVHSTLFTRPLVIDAIICVVSCMIEYQTPGPFSGPRRDAKHAEIRAQLLSLLNPIVSNSVDCPLSSAPCLASPRVFARQMRKQRQVRSSPGYTTIRRLMHATTPFLRGVLPNVTSPAARTMLLRHDPGAFVDRADIPRLPMSALARPQAPARLPVRQSAASRTAAAMPFL